MHDTTTSELSHWITLSSLCGVGIKRIKKLLAQFGTIESICSASKNVLQTNGLSEKQIHQLKAPDKNTIKATLHWIEKGNHYFIPFTDTRYPSLLLEIPQPPAVLYVIGDPNILLYPQIAMVGSRKPTYTGLELAHEFSQQLSRAGLCITSGLAIGIDTASHQGALDANGKTIAVLGSGLLHIYPKKNASLATHIAKNGCVISELPLTTTPIAENFPRRNRIISGLSLGTLVVEAALKSGSLITAHYAAEQGREVFAIPSSIRNPLSMGCLSLIQEGAKCVTGIDDILNEIKTILPHYYNSNRHQNSPSTQNQMLDCTEQQVLACIEYEITTIDQICDRSKLAAQKVAAALLGLELNAVIKKQQNGYIKVITDHPSL